MSTPYAMFANLLHNHSVHACILAVIINTMRMPRPKIELSNYSEVYDFYRDHKQGPKTSRVLYGALGLAFRPRVGYAEGARDGLASMLDSGRTVVLAANHTKGTDPCVIAALPAREEVLKTLVGNAFIPSKPSIFKNGIVRRLVDGLGAVPIWRDEDVDTTTDRSQSGSATKKFLATCIAKLDGGEHMGIFPEGTRNKVDPSRVQELKGGVGLMICRVTKVEQPAIVPIGVHYEEGLHGLVTPKVWIGNPSDEPFARPRDVVDWLPDQMQTCVDQAANL